MKYLFQSALILGYCCFVASAQHPDPVLSHYRQAEAFANQQHYDAALREYRKVLALDANFAEAYSGMGLVYWKTGQIDDAINAFQKALARNNDLFQAHAVMGILLSKRGQNTQAIAHYKQAIGINPQLGWLHSNLAELLWTQNQVPQAVSHYQKAIQLNRKSPGAHLGLGNIYHSQFKFDAALEMYTQAIELELHSPEIYCNRGIIYTKQGEYEKAIRDFREALALNTDYTPARFELGFVYQQTSEYEKAIREYERVMPDRKGDLALHHNLARCYFRLGHVEVAKYQHEIAQQIREFQDTLDTAQRKIREKPDDADSYVALAKIYEEHNQPEKAFEQYKTAILKNAFLMEAYDEIAGLYIQHQQGNQKAITVYKTAVDVNSEYTKGHLMLGLLYRESDQPKESEHHLAIACQLAERAVEMMPNASNFNMLGAVYLAVKDYNQAESAFQETLTLAPDNKKAQEYLQQVRQMKQSASD